MRSSITSRQLSNMPIITVLKLIRLEERDMWNAREEIRIAYKILIRYPE
jgi:hypothetical protein